MNAIKNTIVEAAVLVAVALAVASMANAKRGTGGIKWTKNYFDDGAAMVARLHAGDRGPDLANAARAGMNGQFEPAPPQGAVHDGGADPDTTSGAGGSGPAGSGVAAQTSHQEHPFQEISFEEVVKAFKDPDTASGLNVFVDARNPESFESGHVPGAIHCDPYNVEPYLDDVVAAAIGASKVIVYCNGGDCEDSIFMCRELVEADVPYEAVYLYAGGWKEWSAKGMPIEEGRR
jgi:rhodanese-related sulfurtransferase